MKEVFAAISKRDRYLLVFLLILVIALPLVVFLVKQKQEIRSRAKVAGGPAKMFYSGPFQVNPGQSFSVDLYVDSGSRNVSGVQAYLSYPTGLLDVTGVTINSAYFPIELQKTFGSGTINIAAGIAVPLSPTPTTSP